MVNARNFVLLGAWSTDDWALHLVQFPLSVAQAVVFSVAGVGLVQARLISVAAAVAMAGVLVYGLRRPLGLTGAFAAAVAGSMSALTLYYGRLALLEVPVALALSVAAVGVIRVERGSVGRWGCACGLAIAVALGLKANALPSVLGVLGAGAVRSIREPELRRFLPLAIVIVATAAMVWFAAIAVPNLDQVGVVVPWLVQGAIPRSVAEWLGFVGRFATSNDGLVGLAWPLFMAAAVGGLIVIWEGIRFRRDGTATLGGPARVALVGVCLGRSRADRSRLLRLPAKSLRRAGNHPGLALLVGAGASVIATRMAVRAPWYQGRGRGRDRPFLGGAWSAHQFRRTGRDGPSCPRRSESRRTHPASRGRGRRHLCRTVRNAGPGGNHRDDPRNDQCRRPLRRRHPLVLHRGWRISVVTRPPRGVGRPDKSFGARLGVKAIARLASSDFRERRS